MSGYIYIYYTREFLRHNEKVYKIGRSKDIFQRKNGYPKGSKLLYCIEVDDMQKVETQIINKLKQICIQRTDFGTEYFEGDIEIIKREVNNICMPPHLPPKSEIDESLKKNIFTYTLDEKIKEGNFSTDAMDWAAFHGNLHTIKKIHEANIGCTTYAMDWAAGNGHLEIVKWLHQNRREGCTSLALDLATQNGHIDVVRWLIANTSLTLNGNHISIACYANNINMLAFVLQDVDLNSGYYSFTGIIFNCTLEIVELFLLHDGIRSKLLFNSGGNPNYIIHEILRRNDIEKFRLLAKIGLTLESNVIPDDISDELKKLVEENLNKRDKYIDLLIEKLKNKQFTQCKNALSSNCDWVYSGIHKHYPVLKEKNEIVNISDHGFSFYNKLDDLREKTKTKSPTIPSNDECIKCGYTPLMNLDIVETCKSIFPNVFTFYSEELDDLSYKDQILMHATYEKFYVLDIMKFKKNPNTDNIHDLLHEKYYCYLRDGLYKWYGMRIFDVDISDLLSNYICRAVNEKEQSRQKKLST